MSCPAACAAQARVSAAYVDGRKTPAALAAIASAAIGTDRRRAPWTVAVRNGVALPRAARPWDLPVGMGEPLGHANPGRPGGWWRDDRAKPPPGRRAPGPRPQAGAPVHPRMLGAPVACGHRPHRLRV